MDRVNYATNICGLAKELDLDYTEAEFILKLTEHFERNIGHAVYGQQIKDKNTLLKVLNDCDNDDHSQKIKQGYQNRTQNKPAPVQDTIHTSSPKLFSKPPLSTG